MASFKTSLFPISLSESSKQLNSSSRVCWTLFRFTYSSSLLQKRNGNRRIFMRSSSAVYTQGYSMSSTTQQQRREKFESETDDISLLNERIRRDLSKREVSRNTTLDSKEAEKYIQFVKEQQQKGLKKLKRDRGGDKNEGFSYKVDPYTLHSGDYVVHKKVGIGRFVGIKFDASKDSTQPIEYVFIEYADGMAKLPVKQAARMLYRYNLPNETKKPRTLSKLNDTSVWERRRTKGKIAIQKMVVDLMELYLHRLKQKRPPYPKSHALSEFATEFLYEPTPDQKQAEKTLRNLKVTKRNYNKEYRIVGVTRENCKNLFFPFNTKNGRTVSMTVYDYFTNHFRLNVNSSALLPCLDVRRNKRSLNYLSLGLCTLLPHQTYKNPLSSKERVLIDTTIRRRGPPVVNETIKKPVKEICFE